MFCVFSENTKQEALKIEQEYKGRSKPRSLNASLSSFLALVGRLLFYRPIWTKENQQYHNVRFIYVHFSAWHFAGSDMLWAGIAIRLFQAMQVNFGKLQLVLYRVGQYDEEEEFKEKVCIMVSIFSVFTACSYCMLVALRCCIQIQRGFELSAC